MVKFNHYLEVPAGAKKRDGWVGGWRGNVLVCTLNWATLGTIWLKWVVWLWYPSFLMLTSFHVNLLLVLSHQAVIIIVKVLSKDARTWPGWGLNPDHAIRVVVKMTPLPSRKFRQKKWQIKSKNINLDTADTFKISRARRITHLLFRFV